MIKALSLTLLLSFALFSSLAHAKDASVSTSSDLGVALVDMSSLQGFSSQFKQVLSYAEGGERIYTGELAVSRPGKFRWRYIKPYEQLYVSNGLGVWLYEPDLMQAQRLQDLGEVDPVVLQLLDGRIGLSDVSVLNVEKLEHGVSSWHVRIGQQNQQVEVWLGIQEQALFWIESRDVLGNANRLHLLDVEKIVPDTGIFEFTIPEGVDVIDAEGMSMDKVGAL